MTGHVRFLARALLLLLGGAAGQACAGTGGATQGVALLPQPSTVAVRAGRFDLARATVIAIPANDRGAKAAADRLAELFAKSGKQRLSIGARGAIRFARVPGIKAEGYRLDVTPKGVAIAASDDAGLYYGAVTFWQLATAGENSVSALHIEDAPRFSWRGMMLDSARNFQSPRFVMQLIDWMALHKMNRLHWHLVDDQGWRIEIEKYPRLTKVGGWRIPATAPGAPPLPPTGGYYTQAQIRRIVAYAAARHIMIVPEVEMPGHALSAIRAYPALGMGVPVPPGTESDWGVFPWLYNTDDATFAFLKHVLGEVMALFPAPYIHIGGDEAVKDQWKASRRIQAQIRALGLKDENALQGWFVGRIESFLNAHGRRMIGWDEILEGGLTPNATIMSWRGMDGAVTAAKAGHDAILSPSPELYLDHVQGEGAQEPPGRGGVISLGGILAFDPAPASLDADQRRHILGVQANLWTEHVRTDARAAWMAFPRVSALAELGWSGGGTRNLADFSARLMPQLERLKPFGLQAANSAFTPSTSARLEGGRALVALANQVGAAIRYTTDGRAPDMASPLYSGPLSLALPTRLRAQSFIGEKPLPGALDTTYDAMRIRRREDTQLTLCTGGVALRLEDDAPAQGSRAVFLTDILNPCWIYEAAPLDGVKAVSVTVGQLPFNFQIGKDVENIHFRTPETPGGELEIRIDGCEGARIAVLPLAPAAANPALTVLSAPVLPRAGSHDLCFTYTAKSVNPMWAIKSVQLVPAP